ncbi:MAG: bestrophin family protein [Chloroflexota bacterium]
MIVRSRPKPWELPFFWRLSILPRIAGPIALVMVSSALVMLLEHHHPNAFRGWTVAHFTLLGIALSIFLGFRNSACYERWWEARRQLGALIGEMRSLARIAVTLPGGDRARREQVVRLAIGYTYALMAHLRSASMPAEVTHYGAAIAQAELVRNLPDAILRTIAAHYGAMLAEGEIGEQVWRALDDHIATIASIQVACERIKTTPAPFTYTLLLHRTAYAFCLLLPFGLVGTLGYATPFFCAVVAYAFFGLDALGDELEEPFGSSLNALPLTAMARTVEISLLEALGASDIPQSLQPIRSVLR